jgi:cellulose biosynthesis protein BcsQ
MKILGVYNIKGGVGKTATAVNLAYLAARQGLRTLVWDLDPQAAATFYFRVKPKVKNSKKLLRGKGDLDDVVKGTDFENLDLLPSDFSYRNMDLLLGEAKKPTIQLLRLLRPLSLEYDLVVLDCPPSISLVSENIFRAADALLVPTIPTTLSVRTLQQLMDFMEGHQLDTPVYCFFSMSDRRKRMHLEVMESKPDPRVAVLETGIPYLSDVEKMGYERSPVPQFAPRSPAAQAYEALWREAERILWPRRPALLAAK